MVVMVLGEVRKFSSFLVVLGLWVLIMILLEKGVICWVFLGIGLMMLIFLIGLSLEICCRFILVLLWVIILLIGLVGIMWFLQVICWLMFRCLNSLVERNMLLVLLEQIIEWVVSRVCLKVLMLEMLGLGVLVLMVRLMCERVSSLCLDLEILFLVISLFSELLIMMIMLICLLCCRWLGMVCGVFFMDGFQLEMSLWLVFFLKVGVSVLQVVVKLFELIMCRLVVEVSEVMVFSVRVRILCWKMEVCIQCVVELEWIMWIF